MKAYWDSLTKEQQGELAGKVGSTPGYLRLVFNGYKKASFVLAKKLEQCTSGAITKSDLRPDNRNASNVYQLNVAKLQAEWACGSPL
ncbi:transcriptional regulator [Escherichia fergusonii]|uniref:transcriptional regulator n=1 Tax=Escherichia fergusonii TaxID=564 RepID=UPI003F6E34B2